MTVWVDRREPPAGAGPTLAVKDNIDVEGFDTTAGCPAYAYRPAVSAPAVARLVAAGYRVVGKTALDQFATGLVGTRSPWGAVESPAAPGRVAGGSSSGSAAAVALGEADVALGTDTAGSGRVPAAFCGVVGLKPTRGWVPTGGVVPAVRSLDCVTTFARTVADAAAAVEVAAGAPAAAARPVVRLGVPDVDGLCEPALAAAFGALVGRLPFDVVPVDLAAYFAAGDLLYGGAFVAERHAAVGAFVDAHPDEVDPVVGSIISAARTITAADLARDEARRVELAASAAEVWSSVDAVLLPTAPFHPTVEEVAADPIGVNGALGRFTTGCNLVDWCAAAVPAGTWGARLPLGVSVLGPAWTDRAVWDAARRVTEAAGRVEVCVAGAHLSGQPLEWQLTSRGGRLERRTATAPAYRMVRLPTSPPKPGLVRVDEGGSSVEVEVWSLDPAGFGAFVAQVPSPLCIGRVELADGTDVAGFLCEPHAAAGAEDISTYGGWRAWLAS